MELKLDVKTLTIGILLGVLLAFAIGANVGSADNADFGIAVQNKGAAIVRTSDGSLYIIEPPRNRAERIEYGSGRDKGRPLRMSGSEQPAKDTSRY